MTVVRIHRLHEALEAMRATRQRAPFELAPGGDAGGAEQRLGVGTFWDRGQAEDLVQDLNAAAAEGRDLGERRYDRRG